jgi:hypothetical protein
MATLEAAFHALQMSPGWPAWLAYEPRLPSESLKDQLLLVTQCPSATPVAGYAAWTALGWQVRSGETALCILTVTQPWAPDDSPGSLEEQPDPGPGS